MKPLLLLTLILGHRLIADTLRVDAPQNHQSLSSECIVSLQNTDCLYSARDYLNKDPLFPMKVHLTLTILQILEINDDIGTVYFSSVFKFIWEDTRITNKNISQSSGYGFTLRNWQKRVWYPYLYIKDLKDFKVYEIAMQPSVGKYSALVPISDVSSIFCRELKVNGPFCTW